MHCGLTNVAMTIENKRPNAKVAQNRAFKNAASEARIFSTALIENE